MIAKLRGRLDSAGEDWAVVEAGGVGYLVYCSARTLRALPAPGQEAELHVETHVREDHIHLYGFADAEEREWFRTLQTVQGVGARVALGLLSALGPNDLTTAIAAQDQAALTRANGIGPKVAARILAELKDKALSVPVAAMAGPLTRAPDDAAGEAVSALVNLGYGRAEAYGAIVQAARALGGEAQLAALIRAGLKELTQ